MTADISCASNHQNGQWNPRFPMNQLIHFSGRRGIS
jgi:hypothetical protein